MQFIKKNCFNVKLCLMYYRYNRTYDIVTIKKLKNKILRIGSYIKQGNIYYR